MSSGWRDVCFFCFFFKQKAASDVRISDWSSDVCSSDLQASPRAGAIETADARRLGHAERRLPLERAKHFQPAGQRLHEIGIGGIAGRAHRIDLSPLLDY